MTFILLTIFISSCQKENNTQTDINDTTSIDRLALVTRNNVVLDKIDTLGALSVGNGEFAFTVDASGLQSFPDYYENGISLGTQAQWAWHSIPNPDNYAMEDVAEYFESCNEKSVPYAVQHKEGRKREAANWLRSNPHRLHLGLVGLEITKEDGSLVSVEDLENINQQLDLWTGKIESTYEIEGVPVRVELFAHQEKDGIAAKITSPLIAKGRLKMNMKFPYGKECHVCPGYDWENEEKHQSDIVFEKENQAVIHRVLDNDEYFVDVDWETKGVFANIKPHNFTLTPDISEETLSFSLQFTSRKSNDDSFTFNDTEQNSINEWEKFWLSGAAIDFSSCTDPRAQELERRVILSQYLTKIQCSGSMPPQETGLTMNSWYGKFHLEMHWWHATHFALWNRASLLENSMDWYYKVMEEARGTAKWQGYDGVRWQKMTGPNGIKSPSSVGEFLVWQQPHPIYFAELLYRDQPTKETLEKYKDLVFETAEFMASFAQYSEADQKYHLCHPLIPAQEIFKPQETDDPPFELTYWGYALRLALQWQERLGIPSNETWQKVLNNLAPLPIKDGLYLPTASTLDAYTNIEMKRDHPVVVGAYGILPLSSQIDSTIMGKTFDTILEEWQWETTWGWDYPMMAMAATRLGKPEAALEALFMDVQKNTYLVNGHNYQDKRLRLYLPGNGGLLTAVAMMAAGWDDNTNPAPGFPKNGKWDIKYEGFKPMP